MTLVERAQRDGSPARFARSRPSIRNTVFQWESSGRVVHEVLLRRPRESRWKPPLLRRAWRIILRIKLALIDRRRYERVVIEDVAGLQIVVLPDVFNPKLLRSGEFLVGQVPKDLAPGARVLDLGSGAGAAGVLAARRGANVTAIDINPAAVRCTRINALLNDVEVDIRAGDLFEPVAGERFDLVLFNPPYYRGQPRDALDHAWRSPDIIERFSTALARHLTAEGCALVVLSTDGERDAFLWAFARASLDTTVIAERDLINETLGVYRVRPHARPL
jgi:release factor glutamine methyltransferase